MANLNYEALTKGLKTKSEKIRTLARHGAPTAEIARFLGIRYQHARNVLVDAGLQGAGEVSEAGSQGGFEENLPQGAGTKKVSSDQASDVDQREHVWSSVNADGSVTVPPDLVSLAGLKPGDPVYVGFSNDGLDVLSSLTALKRVQAMAAAYKKPGESVVEEFLRERREEARRVDERFDRLAHEATELAALKGSPR